MEPILYLVIFFLVFVLGLSVFIKGLDFLSDLVENPAAVAIAIVVVIGAIFILRKVDSPQPKAGKEVSVAKLDKVGIPPAQAKQAAEAELNHAICTKQRKVDDLRDIPKACKKRDKILEELREVGVCVTDGKWHLCDQTPKGADNKSSEPLRRAEVTPEIRARHEIGRAMEDEDMECQAGKAGHLQACARRDALQKQLDATYKKQSNFIENPTTKQYRIANSNCRGGSGPMYEEVCAKRDSLYKQLESQGFCYEKIQEGNVINEGWIKC